MDIFVVFVGGQSDAVELLVKSGASVNLQNFQQMAPLHYAAMQPYPSALQILLAGRGFFIHCDYFSF